MITYPRAETRYLPESLIADVPCIVAGLRAGRGFAAIPVPQPPVIRRGASGAFHDKGLAGASHHAVIPNVNTMDDLRDIWPRLSGDERRLFDVIARAYLAAMMPDTRYRQTTVTLDVRGTQFGATGRQLLEPGWRTAFPDWQPADEKGEDAQVLPVLRHGETASLHDASVEDKETRPPPRYHEGTLIEAMQNAWRFITDETLRDRLKDAKGIGTPATRAEIIRGLKAQEFLVTDRKHIVPTERGLALFAVLQQADPALVDPGMTAQMECRLDQVLIGQQEVVAAIDAVCAQASRIIGRLREVTPSDGIAVLGAATRGGRGDRPPVPARKLFAAGRAKQKGFRPPRGNTTSRGASAASLDQPASLEGGPQAPGDVPAGYPVPERPRAPAKPAPDTDEAGVPGSRPSKLRRERPAKPARKPRTGKRAAAPAGATREAAHSPGATGVETKLRIPFGNKEVALRLGARYRAGGWYAPPGVDLARFRERGWL